ncbi:hypothetical protein ASF49_03835 [Methylobacterium sp. Leaf104]|nr:hypothetical protein ASF49_03835 [Methylobacterium sp. Leaf104]
MPADEAVAADSDETPPGPGERTGLEARLRDAGRAWATRSLRRRGVAFVIHASDRRDGPVRQRASGAPGPERSARPADIVSALDETAIRNL